jgi:tyrosinase
MAAVGPLSLEVPVLDGGEVISRADLVFYDVDHSGPSFEARVYVDNPGADESTGTSVDDGYAGSFTVFGHGGCFGEDGHCLPNQRTTDPFDHRAPHPMTGWTLTVIGTEALTRAIVDRGVQAIDVTVVPIVAPLYETPPADDPLKFSHVRLLAYQD